MPAAFHQKQVLLLTALLATVASQLTLALECLEDDAECLRRCRPGTIGELQSRQVETDCPQPSRTKIESQLRCWMGKVPEYPNGLTVTDISHTSALLFWTPSAKWPNSTIKLHYECRLAMEKYLVTFFDEQLMIPVEGSIQAALANDNSTPISNSSVRVDGLRPGQTYNCFLWAEIHEVKGAKNFVKFRTRLSAPAFPVSKLQLSYELRTDSITLRWRKQRPKCDPVSGYKLTVGKSTRILEHTVDHFEISIEWWNQLVGADGLVNVSIAPINAFGSGPQTNVSVMPPPYDDFYLSNNGCNAQEMVYTFENLAPMKQSTTKVCYRETYFQECIRKVP